MINENEPYIRMFLFFSVKCYLRSTSDQYWFEWVNFVRIAGGYIVEKQVRNHKAVGILTNVYLVENCRTSVYMNDVATLSNIFKKT